jgi:ABC-type tungstate transport system substrate-binding protein
MSNNAEIRERMNTYRGILLAFNWIGSIIGIIVGIVLFVTLEKLGGYAAIIIIVAAAFGIIGHFLINVGLAIPFILLNNGDIMENIDENVQMICKKLGVTDDDFNIKGEE